MKGWRSRDRDASVMRLPLAVRAYVIVFMCLWCGGVLAAAVNLAAHGSPATVVPLLMLVFGLMLGYRIFRLSVTVNADDLVVRNHFRTRRVARGDIEGFRVGPMSNQLFLRTIYLLLRDGTVLPLDVAGRPYFFGRGKSVLAERMSSLQGWFDRR